MRNISPLLTSAIFILIASCEYEEPVTTTRDVQLKLGITRSPENSSGDFPDNITIELRLTSAHGESELKDIVFTREGDDYFSRYVALPAGDYEIKDFAVHDEEIYSVEVFFGSFSVGQKNEVVIGKMACRAAKGYRVMVSLYAEGDDKKKLADAMASIYNSEGELYKTYPLLAKTNHITVPSPDDYYELKIEKEGYWPSSTYFIYNQLEKKRLDITLLDSAAAPGPAVIFDPSATMFYMRLQFMDTGSVVLDWRSGIPKETITFAVDPDDEAGTAFVSREMGYVISVPPARITGDVHLIKGIYFDAQANGLEVSSATALQILSLTGGEIDNLDLSNNTKLTSLSLTGMYFINTLTLPQSHDISNLLLSRDSFDTFPTETQTQYIIGNIYANAVAKNIRAGSIIISNVGVSAASADKLSELQSSYGWSVSY